MASCVEVLSMVLDVVADEGADEEVAVVVALQGTDPQIIINTMTISRTIIRLADSVTAETTAPTTPCVSVNKLINTQLQM